MEREWDRELIVNMLIKEMGQAPANLVKAINRMLDDAYENGWEAGVEDSLKEDEGGNWSDRPHESIWDGIASIMPKK